MERIIKVNGQAGLHVEPDRIRLHINIEMVSKEYGEAMSSAEKAQREIMDVIVRAGLAASELKTLSWGIAPEYTYQTNERDEQVKEFAGYRYRHRFAVEFDMNHRMVGKILTEIADSTLAPEISLKYFVSNPEAYKERLLKQTVEDSRKKAEIIAEASGMRLGQPISIVYNNRGGEMMRGADNPIAIPRMLIAKPIDMPDITPSDVELTECITVEWELL